MSSLLSFLLLISLALRPASRGQPLTAETNDLPNANKTQKGWNGSLVADVISPHLHAKDTELASSDTSARVSETTDQECDEDGTDSFPPKAIDTPLLSEDTYLPAKDTPFSSKDTPPSFKDTPSSAKDTPPPSGDTPSLSEDSPLKSENRPSLADSKHSKSMDTSFLSVHTPYTPEDTSFKSKDNHPRSKDKLFQFVDAPPNSSHVYLLSEDTPSMSEFTPPKSDSTHFGSEDTHPVPKDTPSVSEFPLPKSDGTPRGSVDTPSLSVATPHGSLDTPSLSVAMPRQSRIPRSESVTDIKIRPNKEVNKPRNGKKDIQDLERMLSTAKNRYWMVESRAQDSYKSQVAQLKRAVKEAERSRADHLRQVQTLQKRAKKLKKSLQSLRDETDDLRQNLSLVTEAEQDLHTSLAEKEKKNREAERRLGEVLRNTSLLQGAGPAREVSEPRDADSVRAELRREKDKVKAMQALRRQKELELKVLSMHVADFNTSDVRGHLYGNQVIASLKQNVDDLGLMLSEEVPLARQAVALRQRSEVTHRRLVVEGRNVSDVISSEEEKKGRLQYHLDNCRSLLARAEDKASMEKPVTDRGITTLTKERPEVSTKKPTSTGKGQPLKTKPTRR